MKYESEFNMSLMDFYERIDTIDDGFCSVTVATSKKKDDEDTSNEKVGNGCKSSRILEKSASLMDFGNMITEREKDENNFHILNATTARKDMKNCCESMEDGKNFHY